MAGADQIMNGERAASAAPMVGMTPNQSLVSQVLILLHGPRRKQSQTNKQNKLTPSLLVLSVCRHGKPAQFGRTSATKPSESERSELRGPSTCVQLLARWVRRSLICSDSVLIPFHISSTLESTFVVLSEGIGHKPFKRPWLRAGSGLRNAYVQIYIYIYIHITTPCRGRFGTTLASLHGKFPPPFQPPLLRFGLLRAGVGRHPLLQRRLAAREAARHRRQVLGARQHPLEPRHRRTTRGT